MNQANQVAHIRRAPFYLKLSALIAKRSNKQALGLHGTMARTLADMRHLCDELQVPYDTADHVGLILYVGEVRGSRL